MNAATQQEIADVMRTLMIPCAAVTAAISLRVAIDRRYRSGSQLFRFLGLAVLTASLTLGQYHNLGQPPFWPVLIPLWIGVLLSLAGTLPLARSRMRSESLKAIEDAERADNTGAQP